MAASVHPLQAGAILWLLQSHACGMRELRSCGPRPALRRCKVNEHFSSGVANRAFYLMNAGLGRGCNGGALPPAMGALRGCHLPGGATARAAGVQALGR